MYNYMLFISTTLLRRSRLYVNMLDAVRFRVMPNIQLFCQVFNDFSDKYEIRHPQN